MATRSQRLAWVLVTLMLLQIGCAFNQRITCFSNQLIKNHRYGNFKLLFGRDPLLSGLQDAIETDQNCGCGNGRILTPNISSVPDNGSALTLFSCRNIIVNKQSCCLSSRFQSFSSNLNRAYNIVLNNTQYPIVRFLYNLVGSLNSNNCVYPRSNGPDFEPAFKALVDSYRNWLDKIALNERTFINETMCLVCLGVKDYANFIYPNLTYPEFPSISQFIYERDYFARRADHLTGILLELETLHSTMAAKILKFSSSIAPSSSPVCTDLKNQLSNASLLNSKKLCSDQRSCRKIVVKYFGELVSPQLLYFINRLSNNLAMVVGAGTYAISDTPSFGFRGNVTYSSMYGFKYVPNVTLYDESNEYAGLY